MVFCQALFQFYYYNLFYNFNVFILLISFLLIQLFLDYFIIYKKEIIKSLLLCKISFNNFNSFKFNYYSIIVFISPILILA